MGYRKVIKHGFGADDLDAVAVLGTHERPPLSVLRQAGICQIYVRLILLTALAVYVNVHILHAEVLPVALPQLFVVIKVPSEEGLVHLPCGVIVSVEDDEMLRLGIVCALAVAPLVADKVFPGR